MSPRSPGRAGAWGRVAAGAGDVSADAREGTGRAGTRRERVWRPPRGSSDPIPWWPPQGRWSCGGGSSGPELGAYVWRTWGTRGPGELEAPPWTGARDGEKVVAKGAELRVSRGDDDARPSGIMLRRSQGPIPAGALAGLAAPWVAQTCPQRSVLVVSWDSPQCTTVIKKIKSEKPRTREVS